MSKVKFSVLMTLVVAGLAPTAQAEDKVVHVYSTRQESLIQPLLEEFTKETGIATKVLFAKEGLIERLKSEGQASPADVVLTADIATVIDMDKAQLLAPMTSKVVEEVVPAHLRAGDNHWVATTTRARVFYYSKQRVDPKNLSTYEDLADPKWKGKICMRTSAHPYNVSLMASIIAANGEAKAKEWAKGIKNNLAFAPTGGDRDQAKAIHSGQCDVALGNSYYVGVMTTSAVADERAWAEAIGVFFPNQNDRGTHINVGTVALTKASDNPTDATKLVEFLLSEKAQKKFAAEVHEFPVRAGVEKSPLIASWGEFKADQVSLSKIAELRAQAIKIFDEVQLP